MCIGPNVETDIIPKDDGLRIMINAFQSQEFGFGLELSKEQLQEVNKACKGQKCLDVKAAIEIKQMHKVSSTLSLSLHLLRSSSTEHQTRDTGSISTWGFSWKTMLMS